MCGDVMMSLLPLTSVQGAWLLFGTRAYCYVMRAELSSQKCPFPFMGRGQSSGHARNRIAFLGSCMSVEVVGVGTRARVNFGTVSQNSKPCQVTRSDVTKLPEMSTSVYGAGHISGHAMNRNAFFGFLHERGSAWHVWV